MVKRQKMLSASYVLIGLTIALVFAFIDADDYQSGLLSGLGTSLVVVGLIRLTKLYRLSRDPEKQADYEAVYTDERVRYIVNKARALVFVISIYAQLAAGLIAQFIFDQRLLGRVLCYCTCFQCLLFVAVYRYYSKKY